MSAMFKNMDAALTVRTSFNTHVPLCVLAVTPRGNHPRSAVMKRVSAMNKAGNRRRRGAPCLARCKEWWRDQAPPPFFKFVTTPAMYAALFKDCLGRAFFAQANG